MFQLAYISRPVNYDAAVLLDILFRSRRSNAARGVTGLLVSRADIYMQWLEGEVEDVAAIYDKIILDKRHTDVREVVTRDATHRMFGRWNMRDKPADEAMWSVKDVAAGKAAQASQEEVIAIFTRLARQNLRSISA